MLDFDALRSFVRERGLTPPFVTVSGAHLYGFPSPDSDIDLRGAHQGSFVCFLTAKGAAPFGARGLSDNCDWCELRCSAT
jgi:predicted nucleotidyltransferase